MWAAVLKLVIKLVFSCCELPPPSVVEDPVSLSFTDVERLPVPRIDKSINVEFQRFRDFLLEHEICPIVLPTEVEIIIPFSGVMA
jgi:hypothetical protein